MKKLACMILLALAFMLGGERNVYAQAPLLTGRFLDLDVGYRWDKINLNPLLINLNTGVAGVNERFEKIQSFQLGGNAAVSLCRRIYARGQGHYGWIKSGNFSGQSSIKISGGNTQDILGGVGYLFFPSPSWRVGLLGGWSYDKIKLDLRTSPNVTPKFHCQGPWGGFDFLLTSCSCFTLLFGYELHHAHWHGEIHIPPAGPSMVIPVLGLPGGTFKHNRFWGNIANFKLAYVFCKRWSIGIDLRYQIWLAQGKGTYKPDFLTALGVTKNDITNLSWASFSGYFNLGVVF